MSDCEPVVERFCIKELVDRKRRTTFWGDADIPTPFLLKETGRRIEIRPDGTWMLYGPGA